MDLTFYGSDATTLSDARQPGHINVSLDLEPVVLHYGKSEGEVGPCACSVWFVSSCVAPGASRAAATLLFPLKADAVERAQVLLAKCATRGLTFNGGRSVPHILPDGACECRGVSLSTKARDALLHQKRLWNHAVWAALFSYPVGGFPDFVHKAEHADERASARVERRRKQEATKHNRLMHSLNGNPPKGDSGPSKSKVMATAKAKGKEATKRQEKQMAQVVPRESLRGRGRDSYMADHYARAMSPTTLALMAQVMDPDGQADSTTDPALRFVTDPVGVPAPLPDKRMTLPVMSKEKVTVNPGAFCLIQGGFCVRSSATNTGNSLPISKGYNQVVLVSNTTTATELDDWSADWLTNIHEVEPFLYNTSDAPMQVEDDPKLNKLVAGCTNDGRSGTPGFDPVVWNATFGSRVSGGAAKLKPTCFPDSPPLAVAQAGGYTRVEVLFTNQLDAIQLHSAVFRRGRVQPGSQKTESVTVTDGSSSIQLVADGDDFFYPGPFAYFAQGVGYPNSDSPPDFQNFSDTTQPWTGEKLMPTSLAFRCLMHTRFPDGVFDLFDEELYPTPEWPVTTVNLTGAMEKEIGIKVRSPTWDSKFTEFASYNEAAEFGADGGHPCLTPASSVSSSDSCYRCVWFENSSDHPVVLTVSNVDYVCATYSSLLDLDLSPPPDPYLPTASVLAIQHPIFTTPNSFLSWLKKAGNSVLGVLKDVGSAAGKSVLNAIPGAVAKLI